MIRASAIYTTLMGAAMLGTWAFLLAAGRVTEFETTPFQAALLLAVEMLTGVALVLSGWAVLTNRKWGRTLHLVALGMLLYTAVNSIGVFGQLGIVPAAAFFGVVALMTGAIIAYLSYAAMQ